MSPRAVVLWLALPLAACAPLGGAFGPPGPEARYTRAVLALDRGDYPAAREELAWLVGRCEAGAAGRRALLLFASVELDVRNPAGSAGEAARLARAYLDLGAPEQSDLPIARTMYLLAMDLVGAPGYVPHRVDASAAEAVSLAERFDRCDAEVGPRASSRAPEHRSPTTAQRMADLQAELDARADSLVRARATLTTQTRKIEELEAEIARIRKLLGGGGGGAPTFRR